MKLISETLVSRSSMGLRPDYWKPVLQINYGVERRYRRGAWDFFGFFDVRETEWDGHWVIAEIIKE